MAKKIADYKKDIERALRNAKTYSKGLDAQVASLASAMRTLAVASDEIDALEETTVWETTRYGERRVMHPVFKVQKQAQDSVTRQMKALGLTAEALTGTDDTDPLIDLTKKIKATGKKKPVIVKRTAVLNTDEDEDL